MQATVEQGRHDHAQTHALRTRSNDDDRDDPSRNCGASSRTTPPRVRGKVFSQTRPKLAVYTHLVLLGGETVPPVTLEELVAETRQTYEGPLVVGEDLMAFDLGDTVTVRGS